MHPEDIKSTLRKTGTTASCLARELGVSHQAVSCVIRGRFRSLRIARRICELTGLDPALTWPGRYPELRLDPIRFQTNPFQEAA
ncbi:MAG: helix-turn-helix domain-containing protein [Candidatus Accumulibacter phosphatis]|uniref:helix-turn-helix domain-containing protein n=1 Tax=Candidatus Accumulibacter contiguus TaxID=2954381 RepID=UPI00145F81FA